MATNPLAVEAGAALLCPGLWTKRRSRGYLAVALHYTASSVKSDPKWITTAKQGMTARGWNREHELSFEAFSGKPVFPEFDRERNMRALTPIKGLAILRGWDFGYHRPRVIFSQWDGKDWRCLGEFGRQDIGIDAFGREVLDWSAETFGPEAEYEDFCDPAGMMKSDKDAKTSVEAVSELGIYPTFRAGHVNRGLEVIRTLFPDHFFIDPSCQHLTAAFSGGYRYGEDTTTKGAEIPEKDGVHDDWMDALRYAVVGKLGFDRKSQSEEPKDPRSMTLDEYAAWHAQQQGRPREPGEEETFSPDDPGYVSDMDFGDE